MKGAIEAALVTLEAAPDGWLDLRDRRRLREALGPWTPSYVPGGPAVPEERVDAAAAALREDVDMLPGQPEREAAFFAGSAAVRVTTEGWDGDLDPDLYPPELRDLDLDEPRVEALAAWALAYGDPAGTRAYWRWYVTEAFPAAYAVAA